MHVNILATFGKWAFEKKIINKNYVERLDGCMDGWMEGWLGGWNSS